MGVKDKSWPSAPCTSFMLFKTTLDAGTFVSRSSQPGSSDPSCPGRHGSLFFELGGQPEN